MAQTLLAQSQEQGPPNVRGWETPDRILPPIINGKYTRTEVLRRVAELSGKSLNNIKSEERTSDLVRPRQVAAFIMAYLLHYSLPEAGFTLRRDHTSILHLRRKMEETYRAYLQGKELSNEDLELVRLLQASCESMGIELKL
jgi:chromosomal replication initiation ATPase DnaA